MTRFEVKLLSQQVAEPLRSDVLRLETVSEISRGTRARKFGNIDVRALNLGFETGFLSIDHMDLVQAEDFAQARHSKWQLLQQQGFEGFITRQNVLVEVVDEGGVPYEGTLCEDLTAGGAVIYEKEDFSPLPEPTRPPLLVEASKWLIRSIDLLNQGSPSPDDIRRRIERIEDFRVKDAFRWCHYFYIKQGNLQRLPIIDPFLELDVRDVLKMLEIRTWRVGHEVFFIVTSRTQDQAWPYRRKIIIGDLGGHLEAQSPTPGIDRWHRDQLYGMLDFVYRMGETPGQRESGS